MAQRQKTAPSEPVDDLPVLTEKQMLFVKGVLDGKTASDAYRAAYDCENMQPETIWAAASRLRHNKQVGAWLDAAREAELASAKRTLDQHVARLDRLQAIALRTGNVGAAVQAEHYIGKVSGHYTERMEIMNGDPLDTLKQIAGYAPDLARQLAQQAGIEWQEGQTEH